MVRIGGNAPLDDYPHRFMSSDLQSDVRGNPHFCLVGLPGVEPGAY